jgi:hypothetical protein
MTRQGGEVPASVDEGTFGNIPDGLAFTAGERVIGAEVERDARSAAPVVVLTRTMPAGCS